jgi:hypothetical protein
LVTNRTCSLFLKFLQSRFLFLFPGYLNPIPVSSDKIIQKRKWLIDFCTCFSLFSSVFKKKSLFSTFHHVPTRILGLPNRAGEAAGRAAPPRPPLPIPVGSSVSASSPTHPTRRPAS